MVEKFPCLSTWKAEKRKRENGKVEKESGKGKTFQRLLFSFQGLFNPCLVSNRLFFSSGFNSR